MDDATILAAVRAAVRGLRLKADNTRGDDPERFERWRDRYTYRLRDARRLEDTRSTVCELLAEGGTMLGGIEAIAGPDKALELWRAIEEDWKRVRDLALFALGTGEEKSID